MSPAFLFKVINRHARVATEIREILRFNSLITGGELKELCDKVLVFGVIEGEVTARSGIRTYAKNYFLTLELFGV